MSIQQESLDGIFTFYDSTKASLNIYQVGLSSYIILTHFLDLIVCSVVCIIVGGECNIRLALASGVRIILDNAFQFPRHNNSGNYRNRLISYTYI